MCCREAVTGAGRCCVARGASHKKLVYIQTVLLLGGPVWHVGLPTKKWSKIPGMYKRKLSRTPSVYTSVSLI